MSRLSQPAASPRQTGMLSHREIWAALDELARRYGMTASGLAKRAGLDATTFNRSKRQTGDGRLRWPSTESLAKVLDATGATLGEFLALGGLDVARSRSTLPLISLSQAAQSGFFDDAGLPAGAGWDETAFPNIADENAFALEVSDDSMRPLYREGDVVIVSPAAPVRRGDRVAVKLLASEMLAGELKRRTAKTIELRFFNPERAERTLGAENVAWIARIMWSSQ